MLYYNYDKNQILILDQEDPVLYQFDNKIKLVQEKKLDTIECLKILRNESEQWFKI